MYAFTCGNYNTVQMKKTLKLKGFMVVALAGLMALMQSLKTPLEGANANIPSEYLRYAANKLSNNEMQSAPTSDVVPLPFCRNKYIDLSADSAYPIPHWIYSLPKSANKALVLAIAKNESRFKISARSNKGAVGLMQLMPETASYMVESKQLDFTLASAGTDLQMHRPRTAFDFHDPYVSLAVGSRYLQHLQERPYIGNNIVYILAAYNAGPEMLRKWKLQYRGLSEESFAAHIPYHETRNYVRKVLHDYRTYQQLLPPIKETTWVQGGSC